ncbi:MAG TPA: Ppx/GppA phosphatase family protein, partial [Nitrospira sp.]|nr:Ppx/GppA phosphatase family protein [Nitrospira sp.]
GTLTCRLLIADVTAAGTLHELRSERRILKLGEGVDARKVLNPAAMDRVLACLKDWRTVIDSYRVDGAAVVATSAVRDATNRARFQDRVKHETGFDVEVISGKEEARRTMLGIRTGLSETVGDVLAVDIGGGSTELILDRAGHLPSVSSMDLGVVRLTERVLLHDPPTTEEIRFAREWIAKETQAASAALPRRAGARFVGTAGTITSLSAMAQQLPSYQPARIHNYRLTLDRVLDLERQLLALTNAERIGMPGLEKNREGVIAAGAVMLRTIMETLGEKECLVSDMGLREGVLIDLASRLLPRSSM